uniref:Osteocrin n=1 Tax=Acanthochromis polyacanthus TaxID=80966 RepID=A0A3Q1GJ68_9TELE
MASTVSFWASFLPFCLLCMFWLFCISFILFCVPLFFPFCVGEELTAKLLRLDDLVRMENDVMEPKRKRSFPGNNAPLDRLSVSSMETKQTNNKQRVVELPRRRPNPPPIDRIGMSRLPNSRG